MNDAALANGWYVSRDKELVGPIDDQELRDRVSRGVLSREDYAWRDGMELWTQLKDLPGLGSLPRMPSPRAPVQPSYPSVPEAAAPAPKAKQPSKQSSKQRRSEAINRAGQRSSVPPRAPSSAPAGDTGAPWSFPARKPGADVIGEKLKEILGHGAKLPPLVAALIVMGIVFPPAIVPLWLMAFVVYLRSR